MTLVVLKYLLFEQCVFYYNIITKINATLLLIEATNWKEFEEEQTAYNKMIERQQLYISKLKAVYIGFGKFCDDAGLCVHDILNCIDLKATCFNINNYIDAKVTVNQSDIEAAKSMFLECWETFR